MVASFVQFGLTFVLVIGFVQWRRARVHGRIAGAARTLEGLVSVTRRGAPAAPFLWRVANEEGRALARAAGRVADALEAGFSLSDALDRSGGRFFSGRIAAAVRAVDGTAQVSPALDAQRRELDREGLVRHRLFLQLVYPTILTACLVCVVSGVGFMLSLFNGEPANWLWGSRTTIGPHVLALASSISLVGLLLVYSLVAWLLRWGHLLPGQMLRERARVLRTCGFLVRAGMPLPAALQRAATATPSGKLARRTVLASTRLEEGVALPEALAPMCLPPMAVGRLSRSRGVHLAGVAAEVADAIDARAQARVDRLVSWIYPATVIGFGTALLLTYSTLFEFFASVRSAILSGGTPW